MFNSQYTVVDEYTAKLVLRFPVAFITAVSVLIEWIQPVQPSTVSITTSALNTITNEEQSTVDEESTLDTTTFDATTMDATTGVPSGSTDYGNWTGSPEVEYEMAPNCITVQFNGIPTEGTYRSSALVENISHLLHKFHLKVLNDCAFLACPPGYIQHTTKCYRLYGHPDAGLFQDAKERCAEDGLAWAGGGQIAEIHDLATHQFLTQQSFRFK